MKPRPRPQSQRKTEEYESRFDLGALFEFSKNINTTLDLAAILGRFLFTIMGKILSPRSIVMLKVGLDDYRVYEAKGLPPGTEALRLRIPKPPRRLLYAGREDARKSPYISQFRSLDIDIIVPLVAGDKDLGIAGFGSRILKKRLTAKEETYIKSLANIAAAAIEKSLAVDAMKDVNRRLDGRVQELNTLFELSKEFNAVLDSSRLVKLLTFSILGHVGVNRYFVCLASDGAYRNVHSKLDRELDPSVYEYFRKVDAPSVVATLPKIHREPLVDSGIELLIPLLAGSETKGVVGVGKKIHGGEYLPADIEFLSSLGNLAIGALENARLFREAVEKQKLEDELAIAREIQAGLLPSSLPKIPHFTISARTVSSKQVGGDYYDVVGLENQQYALAIGDVSGKGTPASLLMANLQATVRALVPFNFSLGELTRRVNDLMCDNTSSGRFVTFFWGILNPLTRTFHYVNAGHNPPMLFRADGAIERLKEGGIILGVVKKPAPYSEGEVRLNAGDVLVLFTDGVSEAMNDCSEEFGEERLERLARAHLGELPQAMVTRIIDALHDHAKGVPQYDDITLMVLKAAQ